MGLNITTNSVKFVKYELTERLLCITETPVNLFLPKPPLTLAFLKPH